MMGAVMDIPKLLELYQRNFNALGESFTSEQVVHCACNLFQLKVIRDLDETGISSNQIKLLFNGLSEQQSLQLASHFIVFQKLLISEKSDEYNNNYPVFIKNHINPLYIDALTNRNPFVIKNHLIKIINNLIDILAMKKCEIAKNHELMKNEEYLTSELQKFICLLSNGLPGYLKESSYRYCLLSYALSMYKAVVDSHCGEVDGYTRSVLKFNSHELKKLSIRYQLQGEKQMEASYVITCFLGNMTKQQLKQSREVLGFAERDFEQAPSPTTSSPCKRPRVG